MIKVSTTGMAVSLKTDLRFPESGQHGHGSRIIQEKNGTQPLPTMKQLREQKEKLLTQKDTLQKQYDYYRDYQKELHTVCRNVDMILGWNPPIQTTHTKEFQL